MNDAALTLLKNLLATPTPSGWEYDGLKLLADHVAPAAAKVEFDTHDNLRAVMNPGAPLRVMIEGHCDEIGFMVLGADDKGFLTLTSVGGITAPLLAGERVVIQGRKGPVNGVFGARPPHLMKPENRAKIALQALEDAVLDIGRENHVATPGPRPRRRHECLRHAPCARRRGGRAAQRPVALHAQRGGDTVARRREKNRRASAPRLARPPLGHFVQTLTR